MGTRASSRRFVPRPGWLDAAALAVAALDGPGDAVRDRAVALLAPLRHQRLPEPAVTTCGTAIRVRFTSTRTAWEFTVTPTGPVRFRQEYHNGLVGEGVLAGAFDLHMGRHACWFRKG